MLAGQHQCMTSWIDEEDWDEEFSAQLEDQISEDMMDDQGSHGDHRSEVMNYLQELVDLN
jgi:recombinational DNA repair ATPase RecF